MTTILHGENIDRMPVFGGGMKRRLEQRIAETRTATAKLLDPDVSVVIRSKNNARQLEELLRDIRSQVFDGEVEIILVDTESQDDSVAIAKKFGAKIVPITQAEFSYPKALNLGFRAATKPWVFSFVDHSALSSRYVFKVATRWCANPKVAGVWACPLANANATIWERLGGLYWIWRGLVPAHDTLKREINGGLLGANNALIRRDVWQQAGGFDERYAAGAEDWALGCTLLERGYRVIYDPAMCVYHTHGLGFVGCLRQVLYWKHLRPMAFDLAKLKRYRSDL